MAVMSFADPPHYPAISGACALAATGCCLSLRSGKIRTLLLAVNTLLILVLAAFPASLRFERFKYRNFISDLESQGAIHKLAGMISQRGKWEAFEGDVFHEQMFLTTGAHDPPPAMITLVRDGAAAGSLLRISSPGSAEFLRESLRAIPYAFIPQNSRVALLSETGGSNIWLALLHGSGDVAVVNPDSKLFNLVLGPLRKEGGEVFADHRVHLYAGDPRHFIQTSTEPFDLIQLSGLEQLASGGSSFHGMTEDNLLTVEGVGTALDKLKPRGILSVCQGIDVPPRENLKLLTTAVSALEGMHVADPGSHVIQFRDFLGFCTMVRPVAWEGAEIDRLRTILKEKNLTPVWFPGVLPAELNQPDQMPGPRGFEGDWHAFTAGQMFSPAARELMESWSFNIAPATDDNPFFYDFLKWKALNQLRQVYGSLWLTRTEISLLFVCAAVAAVLVASLLLIWLPAVMAVGRVAPATGLLNLFYFAAIGLGYMLFEMVLVSRIARIMGDSLAGPALTITTLLLFSSLGNLHSWHLCRKRPGLAGPLFIAIVITSGAVAWLLSDRCCWPAIAGLQWSGAASALAVAIPAYLPGFPMPLGLLALKGEDRSIALAWGANGFASVLAPPLALAIAMSSGYPAVMVLTALCYTAAGMIWICSFRGKI